MKLKCEKCHGKGGYWVKNLFTEYFQSCQQCKGKGHWWTNNKKANATLKSKR